jgi:hypothetical protein
MINFRNCHETKLFANFIGLSDELYTNDDLTFYYTIERIYSNVKIEVPEEFYQIIDVYFQNIASEEQIADLKLQIRVCLLIFNLLTFLLYRPK